VLLHQICHSAIHARFTEAELGRCFSNIDDMKSDPRMERFLSWVRTKPYDFHSSLSRTVSPASSSSTP
jgi:5-methylcytosine-specific restriction enzyme A